MDALKIFFSKFILLVTIITIILFIVKDKNNKLLDNSIENKDIISIENTSKIKKGSYIEQPKQTKVDNEVSNITVGGIKVQMVKLATYEITGIVMDTESYNDVVGPIDVGLAWGILAKDYNYKNFNTYSVKDRMLTWYTDDSRWIEKMGGEMELKKNCSNNHLVPATDEIRSKILKIEKDQYIRLKGYLVKLEWNVGNTKHIWGPSSLSRTDSGDGACEIIYVNSVEFL